MSRLSVSTSFPHSTQVSVRSRFNASVASLEDPAAIGWKSKQLEVRIRGPREAVVQLSELLLPLGFTSTHLAPEIENDTIFRSYLVAPRGQD